MTDLAEGNAPVAVLVDLLDHRLEAQVGLGRPEDLHHALQLGEVQVAVVPVVEPANQTCWRVNGAVMCGFVIFLVECSFVMTSLQRMWVDYGTSHV